MQTNTRYAFPLAIFFLLALNSLGHEMDIDNNPENFVDNKKNLIFNLIDIENTVGTNFHILIEDRPWSGYPWFDYYGGITYRWLDDAYFGHIKSYRRNYRSWQKTPTKVEYRSPAEKWDILYLGNTRQFIYAESVWKRVIGHNEKHGGTQYWEGICEGYALAAHLFPRPVNPVEVLAVDGTKVIFYPNDLKALASDWASQVDPDFISLGTLAQYTLDENKNRLDNPGFDGLYKNRRYTSFYDVNPGAWAIITSSIKNNIYRDKKAFIMEISYGANLINNHPFYGLERSYYNYQRPRITSHSVLDPHELDEDKIKKSLLTAVKSMRKDKYSKWRAHKAQWIIGVKEKVFYLDFTKPKKIFYDDFTQDKLSFFELDYSLELDGDFNIIGGEWHSPHPDVLWRPQHSLKKILKKRTKLPGRWKDPERTNFPTSWAKRAKSQAQEGQIMLEALTTLFDLSAQE